MVLRFAVLQKSLDPFRKLEMTCGSMRKSQMLGVESKCTETVFLAIKDSELQIRSRVDIQHR